MFTRRCFINLFLMTNLFHIFTFTYDASIKV